MEWGWLICIYFIIYSLPHYTITRHHLTTSLPHLLRLRRARRWRASSRSSSDCRPASPSETCRCVLLRVVYRVLLVGFYIIQPLNEIHRCFLYYPKSPSHTYTYPTHTLHIPYTHTLHIHYTSPLFTPTLSLFTASGPRGGGRRRPASCRRSQQDLWWVLSVQLYCTAQCSMVWVHSVVHKRWSVRK